PAAAQFGYVLAIAAIADEIAVGVILGPPEDRPPYFPFVRRDTQFHVGNRVLRAHDEWQRSLRALFLLLAFRSVRYEQGTQRPACKSGRRCAKRGGGRRRNIGDLARRIGRPEPSLPRAFKFIEQLQPGGDIGPPDARTAGGIIR